MGVEEIKECVAGGHVGVNVELVGVAEDVDDEVSAPGSGPTLTKLWGCLVEGCQCSGKDKTRTGLSYTCEMIQEATREPSQ